MTLDIRLSTSVRLAVTLTMLGIGAVHAVDGPGSAEFRDCSTCPEMVVVPAGDFMRGSPQDEPGRGLDSRNHDEDDLEGPGGKRVRVSVSAFALGVYEVTNRQFAQFVDDTGYEMPRGCYSDADRDGIWGWDEEGTWTNLGREHRPDFPASCIDWVAANAYVRWLSVRTGGRYRLPTEAEFEYALRAGSDTAYHFGDDSDLLCEYGNVPDESRNAVSPELVTAACDDGFADMAPVGQFKSNAFGLHDMTGNVWEWLADCYERSYANVPRDGSALRKDGCEVYSIRGGSWGYDLPSLRSADRSDDPPDARFDGIGLRVARDLLPEPDVPDWELRVFDDRTLGVSVLYPASYTLVADDPGKLFSVASPYTVPLMEIVETRDETRDLGQLVEAYLASLSIGGGKGGVAEEGDDPEAPEPVKSAVTTTVLGGSTAEELSVEWQAAGSQLGLRTLALSVEGAERRITLYLTGTRQHDWDDLRRLARTLRVRPGP